MSSDINPCPYCGDTNVSLINDHMFSGFFVFCPTCSMSGPRGESQLDAEKAWNAIFSHFKWTSEPPTRPGWYFTRRDRPGKPLRVMYVKYEKRFDYRVEEERRVLTMLDTKSGSGYVLEDLNQPDRIWAGPIPEPKKKRE